MTEITPAITEIKAKVSMQDWQQRILDCQSSGMSIKAWYRENGISTSSYYHYPRKIRESVLEENQIVSIEKPTISDGIRIESAGITSICLRQEQLTAVLSALKSC